MALYAIKRILAAVPTLFLVMTATFFVMRLAPGGPFDSEKALPAEVRAALDSRFGLDQPLVAQYGKYLAGVVRGDLGPSLRFYGNRQVSEIIGLSLPVSLQLGAAALVFALLFGVPLGAVSAARQNSWVDSGAMLFAVSGMSLPAYLAATVLILIFSLELGWLPAALWEGPASAVLPAITLGLRPMALIARLTRAAVIEALAADYIRTARAKGLSPAVVLFKHALRNSLIPLVSLLGPLAAALLTGSFVVEVMFAIPGLGRYFVSAVIDRDYTMILGVTLVYGVFLVLFNVLTDLAYGLIDPRVRVR